MIRFRFARPTIPPPADWLPYLEPAYQSRFFTNEGPVLRRFETAMTDRYGSSTRDAVAVTSASAGLSAALMALDVHGSVVIPSFTFPATGFAVLAAGCTPLLCDIDPGTWELDADCLADLLARQSVAAVIHVRTLGFCRNLQRVGELVRSHGIPLIVDAAAAFGGHTPDGTPAGMAGDAEVFSMHATKTFNVGEGGLVMTTPETAQRLRSTINFHVRRPDIDALAMNAKLDDFRAAVALSVLDRIDAFIQRRSAVAEAYADFFREIPGVTIPEDVGSPPWQCFPVQLPVGVDTAEAVTALGREGVEARRYYRPPLHRTTLFATAAPRRLAASEEASERTLCFPVYSDMTDEEFATIRSAIECSLAPLLRQVVGRVP